MKKLFIIAAALIAMQSSSAAAADIKPYAGAGLGMFELDPGQNKKAVIGGFVFAGANLHDYFAVETRLGTTGKRSREELGPLTETFKVNWFLSLLAKPKIAIAENFEVYGLIGATSMNTSFTPVNKTTKQSKTKTGLTFGLGGAYHFNEQLSVGAEWVRYASNADAATKNTTAYKGMDVNGFTTTFSYQF